MARDRFKNLGDSIPKVSALELSRQHADIIADAEKKFRDTVKVSDPQCFIEEGDLEGWDGRHFRIG